MNKKHKILYVDDELINLQLFKINFSKKYEVFMAEDGFKGLEALDENPEIAVVVSDMRMPAMNGLEFIKKAKEKHPHICFYILTGYEITSEIMEAINSQLIQKYFMKPFSLKEVDIAISEAIEQKLY